MVRKIYKGCMVLGILLGLQTVALTPVQAIPQVTSMSVQSSRELSGEWREDGKGIWYQYSDGSYARNGWKFIDGSWYYFSQWGYVSTEWKKIGSKWYYFNEKGVMQTGLQTIGTQKFYFKESGAMATAWQKIDGAWYYFRQGGSMVQGWMKIENKWYFFTTDGKMITGSHTDGGKEYFFKSDGAMFTGWKQVGNYWYYYKPGAGCKLKSGWWKTGGKWYYFDSEGKMASNRFVGDYFVNSSGAMVYGWKIYNNKWYYFRTSTGAMYKNYWLKLGTKYYYLKSDGTMAKSEWIGTSWCNSSGVWDPLYGKKEMTEYFKMNFNTVVNTLPNMKLNPGTKGFIQYGNNYLLVSTNVFNPSSPLVGFVEIMGACDYTVAGVKYGMTSAQAIAAVKEFGYTTRYSYTHYSGSSNYYYTYQNSKRQRVAFVTKNGKVFLVDAYAYAYPN